jgi:hypothetical protein
MQAAPDTAVSAGFVGVPDVGSFVVAAAHLGASTLTNRLFCSTYPASMISGSTHQCALGF